MVCKNRKASIALLICVSLCLLPSFAQKNRPKQDEKDLVRLVKATSIEMKTVFGVAHRISIDATFLHNGTYLKCDTADWDVDAKYIKAWGNVTVSQDKVVLSSDRMDYDVETSTAKFRSDIVQLKDEKHNVLRTSTLDYCTKDSIAVFHDGGSMTMEDGQIIESEHGIYDTGLKKVNFIGDVNMYVDTVYVKTEALDYDTAAKVAYFTRDVDFFREGDMMSARRGWYNRETETFYFQDNVHCMSDRREAWCDSMYYFKLPNDVMMLGDAQVQDTLKHITAVADYMLYESEIRQLTLSDNAAVAMRTVQNDKVDTLYCGADNIIYNVEKFGNIEESEKVNAEKRKSEILTDAVSAYRERVQKEAQDAEEKRKQELEGPSIRPKAPAPSPTPAPEPAPTPEPAAEVSEPSDSASVADSTAIETGAPVADSTATEVNVPVSDSTATTDSVSVADSTLAELPAMSPEDLEKARADSIAAAVRDSADVGFVHATGNVRVFRSDMQMRCDSMEYNALDSVARFFIDPVIWNEGNRQYTSDSMFVLIKNEAVDRANLRSNAMIITQEDSVCFDQIKSTEVMAFFNEESELTRFDAMGTAKAVFYLEENGALATVNVVDSKILSGDFKNGEIDRITYFDAPKNDAYPTVQLPEELKRLKGFNWQPERRPASKYDITHLVVKPNEMVAYSSHPKPFFRYTKKYFPGGIEKIAADLQEARRRRAEEQKLRDSLAVADTLSPADSLLPSVTDSIAVAVQDSSAVGLKPVSDSLSVSDSSRAPSDSTLSIKEEEKISVAEQKRQAREAARKAKWDELDRRDAVRAEAKRQKELALKRKKTLKALLRQREQDIRDAKKLKRYIEYYEKQKARRNKNGETVE